jgi:hypothetical protein
LVAVSLLPVVYVFNLHLYASVILGIEDTKAIQDVMDKRVAFTFGKP